MNFSKPANLTSTRSVEEIKSGLLRRAFNRGGQKEREKMELLIEWRLAACRHSNRQALKKWRNDCKLDSFDKEEADDSRWLNARNLVAHIEGRRDRLRGVSPNDNNDLRDIVKAEVARRAEGVKRHNDVMDVILNAPQLVEREQNPVKSYRLIKPRASRSQDGSNHFLSLRDKRLAKTPKFN